MVLRLISRSPWRSGFFVTIAPEKLASQELDASVEASGPHDFAVRLSAVRQRRISVHRILSRVTISSRPSVGQDGRGNKVICANTEAQYFSQRSSTGKSLICPPGRIQLCRVGKGALAPCPPFPFRDVGGHAEFIIGRAFARPVGFCPPTICAPRQEKLFRVSDIRRDIRPRGAHQHSEQEP